MGPIPPRDGDLYHQDFGDEVHGGQVTFDYKGEKGRDHHSVYGEGRHFSWDSYPAGDPRNDKPGPQEHFTPHS
jgi:hypothetical protein